jgi:HK97 family phage portal protein
VLWIARTFPEAPPAVWLGDDSGVRNRLVRHPLIQLLRYPTSSPDNPGGFYSGVLLWMATLTSWVLDGNAYWFKVRSALGRVVQLWYVPHWMLEPMWPADGSEYLSHYEYRIDGRVIPVPASEIVHFRHGLDAENTRKGQSPLRAVLREVYTDEEAARFTASILKNLGLPGVVISPDTAGPGGPWRPNSDDAKAIKADFKEKYSGDRRGDPIVMSGPTKIATFGFSPTEMTLRDLRNIPEERITAVLGIPAAVVGFGAGLQYTKVGATFAGFRDQAWQSNLIPTQRLMSAEIQTQLLPDFETDLEAYEFGFDISKVKVLQEDQGKMAERWARLVSAGIAKRAEARNAFDLVSGPEDDVYLPQPGVQGSPSDAESTSKDLQAQIEELQAQLDAQPAK